ncbi:hypothetical protein CkaCkLH20_00165 [Colletotrichum karsti]|uniref:Uncharacterized protein n=1 Tax=Colletotrichum karsti TaxID=1095194 RepID=A0A9P6IGP6_9PEZI|nr:uncharacterized protein CkaCkLH20_00165 [Colletotrichum karsti]KAF9882129.1 hypothetical protein CkaCkLH20_00165 [Colletotrichum karsti]
MDVVVHECDDPLCNEHQDIFKNAEIRRIKDTTRFKSQPRDSAVLGYEKQLRSVKITPRKNSMIDLTRPCKFDQEEVPSGKDQHKNLQQQPRDVDTAIIHDPAVVMIGVRDVENLTNATLGQTERFQELLRKLHKSAPGHLPPVAVSNDGIDRPRQDTGDSGDSGIDVRSPIKRSLNPLAKEFAAFSSHENPVVAEKRGSETSMNIPLSILKQIMGQGDKVTAMDGNPELGLNETILNTIQRFGIPNVQPKYITPPLAFSSPTMVPHPPPPSMVSSLGSSPIPSGVSLQSGMAMPPFSPFAGLQPAPAFSHFPGFANPAMQNMPMAPPTLGPQFSPHGFFPSSSGYGPPINAHIAGRQFNAGPAVLGSPFAPRMDTTPPFNPNSGSFNPAQASTFVPSKDIHPPPKPRVPDAMGQQNYEAWIEHKKATDPAYALQCKQRQANRIRRAGPGVWK